MFLTIFLQICVFLLTIVCLKQPNNLTYEIKKILFLYSFFVLGFNQFSNSIKNEAKNGSNSENQIPSSPKPPQEVEEKEESRNPATDILYISKRTLRKLYRKNDTVVQKKLFRQEYSSFMKGTK